MFIYILYHKLEFFTRKKEKNFHKKGLFPIMPSSTKKILQSPETFFVISSIPVQVINTCIFFIFLNKKD